MLHKRNLSEKKCLSIVLLSFKAIIPIYALSIAIIAVLVPIINYCDYLKFGISNELEELVIHTSRRLIPFAISLPVIFLLRLFLETNNKEIMQVYVKSERIKITICSFLLTNMFVVPIFIIYSNLWDGFISEFLKIGCISFFLFGISYLLMSIFSATAVSLIVLLIYEVYVITSNSYNIINYVYFDSEYTYWIILFLLGTMLTLIGEVLIKKIRGGF